MVVRRGRRSRVFWLCGDLVGLLCIIRLGGKCSLYIGRALVKWSAIVGPGDSSSAPADRFEPLFLNNGPRAVINQV